MNRKQLVEIGGQKVKELVSEDDQADAKTATTVAQRLIDASTVGWATRSAPHPCVEIYNDAGIPQVRHRPPIRLHPRRFCKTAYPQIANDVA